MRSEDFVGASRSPWSSPARLDPRRRSSRREGGCRPQVQGRRAALRHAPGRPTDLVFGTSGRFYTLSCDKLPSARAAMASRSRLMIELGNEQDIVLPCGFEGWPQVPGRVRRRRGFVVPRTRSWRRPERQPRCSTSPHGRRRSAVGRARTMPFGGRAERGPQAAVFPLDQVPEMGCAAAALLLQKLQRADRLSDVQAFRLGDGCRGQIASFRPPVEILARRACAGWTPAGKGWPRADGSGTDRMDLTLIWRVVIGVVEGLIEVLPVSSTGHIIPRRGGALNFEGRRARCSRSSSSSAPSSPSASSIVRRSLGGGGRRIAAAGRAALRFAAVVVAFLPAAVIGVVAHKYIKSVLFSPWVVAISLIVGGIAILAIEGWRSVAHQVGRRGRSQDRSLRRSLPVPGHDPRRVARRRHHGRPGGTRGSRDGCRSSPSSSPSPTAVGGVVYDLYKELDDASTWHGSGVIAVLGFLVAFGSGPGGWPVRGVSSAGTVRRVRVVPGSLGDLPRSLTDWSPAAAGCSPAPSVRRAAMQLLAAARAQPAIGILCAHRTVVSKPRFGEEDFAHSAWQLVSRSGNSLAHKEMSWEDKRNVTKFMRSAAVGGAVVCRLVRLPRPPSRNRCAG